MSPFPVHFLHKCTSSFFIRVFVCCFSVLIPPPLVHFYGKSRTLSMDDRQHSFLRQFLKQNNNHIHHQQWAYNSLSLSPINQAPESSTATANKWKRTYAPDLSTIDLRHPAYSIDNDRRHTRYKTRTAQREEEVEIYRQLTDSSYWHLRLTV
jgi:hypothetical protein